MSLKLKIIILSVFIALLGGNALLKPYFDHRDAMSVLTKTFHFWTTRQMLLSYDLWEDPDKSPPIYSLESYHIKNQKFYKKEGVPTLEATVTLLFPADTLLPSNQDWLFKLRKTRLGWKIASLAMIKTQN